MDAGAVSDMLGGFAADVVPVGILPAPGIPVGGTEEHQDLFALADAMSGYLDIAGRRAEEGLHGALEADRFLERVARQRRILAQPGELVRESRQAIDCRPDAVNCRVDPGGEQRAHQHRRFGFGNLSGVDPRVDATAKTFRREILTLTLFGDISLVRRRAVDRILAP